MTNLFFNITEENKSKLLRELDADTFIFQKNTTILTTVKLNNIIGYIISGCIQIIRNDYNGSRIIIDELDDGKVFGSILSSISNGDYDIITKEETKIILIEYNTILSFPFENKDYNQFIKNLLQITREEMEKKNDRIEVLTKKTIRNKLLEYFDINSKSKTTRSIYLPFSFTDLADYLAVDRSAMSRELSNLKKEGLIVTRGRKITLLYKI